MPEMTFIGIEFEKALSFEEVYQLVITFKERINSESFRNVDDIFVIKGIDSLPQYNVSDANPFKLKFSLIVGIPIINADSIPDDMKAIMVPPHTYARYLTKINFSLKSLVDDELPIINSITQQYKTSKFPLLVCYHLSDAPFVAQNIKINS